HTRAIARHYSRHSSANNHLIGELAGVFVASCTWPMWPGLRRLGERARAELEAQARLQVASDGVLREQAFEYASFVFDLLFIVELAASAAGRPMSGDYLGRLMGLCHFIRSVRTGSGAVPMIGDADGAQAWRLDPREGRCPFESMLAKGEWLGGAAASRSELRWLAPRAAPVVPQAGVSGLDFRDGGYHLFQSDAGGPREVRGLFDAGPLGYLGIAAHGHADALQVWLALGGVPLLVDPGTYGYGVGVEWRDYFRGTSAHNTVCIARRDQSLSGGRFMWTQKARTQLQALTRDGDALTLRAAHDGYRRLQGFTHERGLVFDPQAATLEVSDRVQGEGEQLLQLHWHVSPQWHLLRQEGETVTLGRAGIEVKLTVSADVAGSLSVHSGEQDPPLGWYSVAYGEKEPCAVLRWQGRAARANLRTRIEWRFGAAEVLH
ncbi:heparinase II/III-family protein, partial [Pelomonas sp. KK5]|uniref:heparinase II/III family protein n=1 Tax=Pelomonas sp. KK5 TaxID=1855730 RepID=UPI0018E91F6A